ncbi:bacterial alpha-L-rhamnosidase-domain-containing protein [Mycena crocata]|nr:bacterial alpha-L-rhamnosidase-domain-containing protein [Mycena crocata]
MPRSSEPPPPIRHAPFRPRLRDLNNHRRLLRRPSPDPSRRATFDSPATLPPTPPCFKQRTGSLRHCSYPGSPNTIRGCSKTPPPPKLGRSHIGVTQWSVWNWNSVPCHGDPVLRLVLSIAYSDGSKERVVSDASWKVAEGPTLLNDIFGGDNYDGSRPVLMHAASYIIPLWDLASSDDSTWNQALLETVPKGTLVPARQPPTRVRESLSPIKITEPAPGAVTHTTQPIFRSIRSCCRGLDTASAQGPKGNLITVHYGEKLNPDGTGGVSTEDEQHYYPNNSRTHRFSLAGTGAPGVFEPKFSYKGYRYVPILGWPGPAAPTPAHIIGQVVHDDLTTFGDFISSSNLLNKLHAPSVFAMLNNVHPIPMDRLTFEKNGRSGDAMLAMVHSPPERIPYKPERWSSLQEIFLINFDSADLSAKYSQDLHDFVTGGPPAVIVPDSGCGANNQADPRQYTMMTMMSNVATVINNTADTATFTSQAATIKTALNNVFLNRTAGHYSGVGDSGYPIRTNLLALAPD